MGDRQLVEQIVTDFRAASALSPKDRAMLEYAARVAREPEAMTEEDVARLRLAGFSDRGILEINLAASYMSFVNRIAQGLGVELEAYFGEFTR